MTQPITNPTNPALAWVSVRHLQHMLARGEAAGLRMDEMLEEAGISRSLLSDADGLVPMTAIEKLLAALSRRYADPLVGLHLAADLQPATFGALGYILQACASYADVLETAIRYNGLLSNIGTTSLAFGPGTVEVCWSCSAGGEAFRRQATDYVLGAFVVLARVLMPEQKDLLRAVNLAHARPEDAERSREYFSFFQAPVYFDRPHSSLVLPASLLKVKLPHGDAAIKQLLENHTLSLLRQRGQESSLADAVRRLIDVMILDTVPTKEAIALQLGISGRSLHRKLQEAGTSYRDILDAARLDMACHALQGRDSVTSIAAQLGFSTHQAFLRWFRREAGMTPGEYRKTQKAEIHRG